LQQDPLERVLAIGVPTTFFKPEIVQEKASEDIERLSSVGEATRVISVKVRGVVFFFEHRLSKEDEGPGDGEAVGRLPFVPDAEEGIPGLLGGNAFHETMLGGLRESLVAAFAEGHSFLKVPWE
jgi:hypothetical protein